MKFIGRKEELRNLESAYRKDNFQMCILWSKKSWKNNPYIYFTAIKGSLKRNIELVSLDNLYKTK